MKDFAPDNIPLNTLILIVDTYIHASKELERNIYRYIGQLSWEMGGGMRDDVNIYSLVERERCCEWQCQIAMH